MLSVRGPEEKGSKVPGHGKPDDPKTLGKKLELFELARSCRMEALGVGCHEA